MKNSVSLMPGHIPDRHVPAQLQRIALKLPNVGIPGSGKADLCLADRLAFSALHARNTHADENRLGADWHLPPDLLRPPVVNQLSTSASRTGQCFGSRLDGEDDLPLRVLGAHVMITFETPSMIQEAGGHTLAPLSASWLPL